MIYRFFYSGRRRVCALRGGHARPQFLLGWLKPNPSAGYFAAHGEIPWFVNA